MLPGSNTSENSQAIWTAALNTSVSQPRPRGRVRKSDIVHFPEFQNATEHVDDPFWVDILTACSKKKFPRGFSYSDRLLRHRTNDIIIALPDDPQHFAQTAIYFFQENGKLLSERDQANRKKQEEREIIDKLTNASSDWTKVSRSKNRRTIHVRDYVERKYKHFSKAHRDELFTQINIGFENKYITKDHIDFTNGQIECIDGIDMDNDGQIEYSRTFPNSKIDIIYPEIPPKNKIYEHYANWIKLVEEFHKFVQTSSKSAHTYQTVSGTTGNLVMHST